MRPDQCYRMPPYDPACRPRGEPATNGLIGLAGKFAKLFQARIDLRQCRVELIQLLSSYRYQHGFSLTPEL